MRKTISALHRAFRVETNALHIFSIIVISVQKLHLLEVPPSLVRPVLTDTTLELLDLKLHKRVLRVAIPVILDEKIEGLLLSPVRI